MHSEGDARVNESRSVDLKKKEKENKAGKFALVRAKLRHSESVNPQVLTGCYC